MSEITVELKDLVGLKKLSGVENLISDIESGISFRLDGVVYTAVEDENDGYRSCLSAIYADKYQLKNEFPAVKVFCALDDGILKVYDVSSGKIILQIGTNFDDSYYPCFIHEWTPENMA